MKLEQVFARMWRSGKIARESYGKDFIYMGKDNKLYFYNVQTKESKLWIPLSEDWTVDDWKVVGGGTK